MSQGRSGQRIVVRPHPQEAAGPRLRVHPRQRVSARALLLGTAVLAFVVLGGAVAIQAERIEAQRTIDRLDRDLAAASAEHRQLRADVAGATSPTRILAAASGLELVEPAAVVPLVPAVVRPGGNDPVDPAATLPPEAPADLAEGAGGADRSAPGEHE